MSNFQYPNITGRTTEEKIGQIVSYLRQLVDQLNYEGLPSNASELEGARNVVISLDQILADKK